MTATALVFRFDAGPHDFSGAHPGGTLDRLLRRLGCAEKIEWLRHDYRMIGGDGEVFDPPRDGRAHAEALARRHPEDGDGIKACFGIMKALYDAMLDSAQEADFSGPPQSVDAMLAFAKEHPLYPQWAERPYAEMVARHVRGEAARAALTHDRRLCQRGRFAPRPAATWRRSMAISSTAAFIPGRNQLFLGTPRRGLLRQGRGDCLQNRREEILVEQGRAAGLVLDNGEIVRARAVVANSDPRRTFLELLDPALLPKDSAKSSKPRRPRPRDSACISA